MTDQRVTTNIHAWAWIMMGRGVALLFGYGRLCGFCVRRAGRADPTLQQRIRKQMR
jgi:hypothetical protein